MAYAGLDVGTSGCKITVYDLEGNRLYQASRKYSEQGTQGHRELDAEIVAENVMDLLKEVGLHCPQPVDGIAIASLGESVVCLDEQGRCLLPSMLTGDCRGIEETGELVREVPPETILEITGLPPNELYSLSKLIWLKRHTDVLQRAKMIFFFEDYIGYLLTGQRMVSYSSACRSMAFDIRKNQWSQKLLALAGLVPEQLSKPVQAGTLVGTLLPRQAAQLRLPGSLKVYAGGHDQSCAALGSGLIDSKGCETSMGTCEFMLFMLPQPHFEPYMIQNDFTCIPYVLPHRYLSSLEVTTCGILKNWGMKTFFPQVSNLGTFYEQIEGKIRGLKTEVLALPQFGSRGNPDLSMDARGVIAGLSIHTQPEEIYLALLEGISFQLYLAYERLSPLCQPPEYIVATGGGAASDAALQLRANVFGLPVRRLQSEETGALGCMMLAALGAGAYPTLEESVRRTVRVAKVFTPDEQDVAYYQNKFQKYKALYQRMYDFQ